MTASAFRQAVESGDHARAVDRLAPDVVFRSPVVFRPYTGRDAVAGILEAVFRVFEDFRYSGEVLDGDREVLFFQARVGDRTLDGVDIIRVDGEGRVAELTVMVRPMSGMLALAEAMRERLAATP